MSGLPGGARRGRPSGAGRGRRLLTLAAAAAVVVLAACGGGASGSTARTGAFQAVEVDPPTPRPSFTLTDTEGRPYDFARETAGRTTLLYFGYTYCPDICPVHLANIKNAFEVRPDLATETVVVFVSVDPERDTPEVLRAYLDKFDTRIVGLWGTRDEVLAAEAAAGVPPAAPDLEDPALVGHAAQVLGYGADDLLHVQFPAQTRGSAFAHDLAVLAGKAPAP